MAKGYDVLEMLIPEGGYIQVGDDYEGITFIDCKPISKEEYQAGFAKYDAWKAEQDAATATRKAALLKKLGVTEEELGLLLA